MERTTAWCYKFWTITAGTGLCPIRFLDFQESQPYSMSQGIVGQEEHAIGVGQSWAVILEFHVPGIHDTSETILKHRTP